MVRNTVMAMVNIMVGGYGYGYGFEWVSNVEKEIRKFIKSHETCII